MIEANVRRLPVPASWAKERLLRMVLQPAVETPVPRPVAVVGVAPVADGRVGSAGAAKFKDLRVVAGGSRVSPVDHGCGWPCLPGRHWQRRLALIAAGIWLGNVLSHKVAEVGNNPVQAKGPEDKTPPSTGPTAKIGTGKQIQDPFKKGDKKPAVFENSPVLMAKLVECDVKLAAPESKHERVEALAAMAEA